MKAHGDDAMTGRSPVRCAVRSETPSGAAVAENTSPTPDPRTRGEHGTEHAAQAPGRVAVQERLQQTGVAGLVDRGRDDGQRQREQRRQGRAGQADVVTLLEQQAPPAAGRPGRRQRVGERRQRPGELAGGRQRQRASPEDGASKALELVGLLVAHRHHLIEAWPRRSVQAQLLLVRHDVRCQAECGERSR